jgi:hypothetical protein
MLCECGAEISETRSGAHCRLVTVDTDKACHLVERKERAVGWHERHEGMPRANRAERRRRGLEHVRQFILRCRLQSSHGIPDQLRQTRCPFASVEGGDGGSGFS